MSQIDRGGARLADAVRQAYAQGQDDYHLEPMVLARDGRGAGTVRDGDAVVFCCRRGEREIRLPCWAALGDFSPAAGALAVLRAVMEVVYRRPGLERLTLLCASPEELAVFQFQWNMWFAAEKPPHSR